MIIGIDINEVWSYRPNASDLYNIERTVNPAGGGGARYIQIRKSQLEDLLQFLDLAHVPDSKVSLNVKSIKAPEKVDVIEFDTKSQERMRIANQNRHWRTRAYGWSPAAGFPTLGPTETTEDANHLINLLGGLHIYLVRDVNDKVWAGYTTGSVPPPEDAGLPFIGILYTGDGGYWRYTG
ncbi:MAG: hypothetical protein AABM64_11130 [Pseudomonadota bacterium]